MSYRGTLDLLISAEIVAEKEDAPKLIFVVTELRGNAARLEGNELVGSKAQINTSITRTGSGFKIVLTTDKFAKAVYLDIEGAGGTFSDNYFVR